MTPEAVTPEAVTPDDLIAAVDEKRRPDMQALDALITDVAPGLERVAAGKMIGYGPFHYHYASGREGDATLLGLAAGARGFSLYVLSAADGRYLAESYADRLGKANVGKSCVRFTRLAGLDLDAVRELVAEAARVGPGEAAGTAHVT